MDDKKKNWNKDKIRKSISEKIPGILLRKDRLLILLLGGLLLLVIAVPIDSSDDSPWSSLDSKGTDIKTDGGGDQLSEKGQDDYVEYLETHLEEVLSQIEDVGEVTVMVTVEDLGEQVVEKDRESTTESVEEEDSQGGMRTTKNSTKGENTVYSSAGEGSSGSGEPYVTKEKMPVIEGVVVIADGGDHAVAVQNITEAVQALFDIDTHKIKVMKRNQK